MLAVTQMPPSSRNAGNQAMVGCVLIESRHIRTHRWIRPVAGQILRAVTKNGTFVPSFGANDCFVLYW
jgi:hypothetical protein